MQVTLTETKSVRGEIVASLDSRPPGLAIPIQRVVVGCLHVSMRYWRLKIVDSVIDGVRTAKFYCHKEGDRTTYYVTCTYKELARIDAYRIDFKPDIQPRGLIEFQIKLVEMKIPNKFHDYNNPIVGRENQFFVIHGNQKQLIEANLVDNRVHAYPFGHPERDTIVECVESAEFFIRKGTAKAMRVVFIDGSKKTYRVYTVDYHEKPVSSESDCDDQSSEKEDDQPPEEQPSEKEEYDKPPSNCIIC
jgi:hypothetical protein